MAVIDFKNKMTSNAAPLVFEVSGTVKVNPEHTGDYRVIRKPFFRKNIFKNAV
jgi:hypothetical protein